MTKIRMSDPLPPKRDDLRDDVRPWLRYAGIVAVVVFAGSATIAFYYGPGAFEVIGTTLLASFR